ncbi:hypothetical protein DDQ50_13120 [Amnibacterium flavum]|uniref:Type IV secretion protein Rhs n=1 Tax=Amnibacterium flavum TaxID=2173173 RepID=A0A2V1HUB1_9MICO|nr:hypothetical protein DDQ50_13120 [Amnibacterium flavum]
MARTNGRNESNPRERGLGGVINRLNDRLRPYIGPPQLGPYDEVAAPAAPPACPLCGFPMSEHRIERGLPRTMLHCPTGMGNEARTG